MPFPIGILEPSQVPISHHGRASRHSATLTYPNTSVDPGLVLDRDVRQLYVAVHPEVLSMEGVDMTQGGDFSFVSKMLATAALGGG